MHVQITDKNKETSALFSFHHFSNIALSYSLLYSSILSSYLHSSILLSTLYLGHVVTSASHPVSVPSEPCRATGLPVTTAGSHVMSSSIATWTYEIGVGSVMLG